MELLSKGRLGQIKLAAEIFLQFIGVLKGYSSNEQWENLLYDMGLWASPRYSLPGIRIQVQFVSNSRRQFAAGCTTVIKRVN